MFLNPFKRTGWFCSSFSSEFPFLGFKIRWKRKKDFMECGEYFVSSTFAGDTMALRAFMTQCKLFHENKFNIDDLWNAGRKFQERFNEIYPDKVKIEGYPTRGSFTGDLHARHLLFQEAALAGILLGPSFFFNFGHLGLEDQVLNTLTDIFFSTISGSS